MKPSFNLPAGWSLDEERSRWRLASLVNTGLVSCRTSSVEVFSRRTTDALQKASPVKKRFETGSNSAPFCCKDTLDMFPLKWINMTFVERQSLKRAGAGMWTVRTCHAFVQRWRWADKALKRGLYLQRGSTPALQREEMLRSVSVWVYLLHARRRCSVCPFRMQTKTSLSGWRRTGVWWTPALSSTATLSAGGESKNIRNKR